MANPHTNVIRNCEKCSKDVKLYIICFKCDFIYHPNCWRKLPGAYLNEKGHAFCCWNMSSKHHVTDEDLEIQEDLKEGIEEENEDECYAVFGHYQQREADLQKIKYRCELCHFDFRDEICLKSHYKTCTFSKQKLSKKHLHLTYKVGRTNVLNRHTFVEKYEQYNCTHRDCKCIPGQKGSCKCDAYGFATGPKYPLTQHASVMHSETKKKYKCSDCKYSTDQKYSIDRHIRSHTNDKQFKCTYKNCKCTAGQDEFCKCSMCGYAAVQKGTLKMHILRKHSTEPKKYKCANCNYAAHKKSQLERHMRIHTKRPFKCTYKKCECTIGQEASCKCDMCEYAATEKCNLKKHMLVKHSGESKKYKKRKAKHRTTHPQYIH